ncbi:thermonuclease family protein [uncultured Winogradskyella sp.]|uniref:thermonuclease family protein n=1 Tax=uncultured Winogradskyella sp. TaxID=395353 RepID=UPI0030D8A433|tara:strand:- start:105 stop:434 length:330 start_codon:yes stop_codon:yes gene_type:complete
MYQYKAKIIDVYDGDTVTALVDLGFLSFREMKLRLYGIDTPELRGVEKVEGKKVRDIVRRMILGKEVTINSFKDKQGKYGRYLATIVLEDGLNINQWLVENGYAKPYLL